MSGSVLKAHPDVREALLDMREWSGVSLGCPRVVRNPSRLSGRPSRKFGRPYRMYGSCRETFPNVQKWSGIYPRCPGGPTG